MVEKMKTENNNSDESITPWSDHYSTAKKKTSLSREQKEEKKKMSDKSEIRTHAP
jgi:hypothetical protein